MPERNSDQNAGAHLSPECFQAYVSAEIKVPNTLIAVGPYVGRAALASLPTGDDLAPAVTRFATTFSFSTSQTKSAMRTVGLLHGKFGIPVLPEGVDLRERAGIRVFPQRRFEVVYMEGVLNILEAILRLHGLTGETGIPRESRVAELLGQPAKLAATVAVFAAAEGAVNGPESTSRSEAFKAKFNFTDSGEKPRAMAPDEKDAIQGELVPLMADAVRQALRECDWTMPPDRLEDFMLVLTSPELHDEAA